MRLMHAGFVALLALILIAGTASAQWPDDPATNLVLSSGAGEQTVPLIERTSDGGAWILFYNNGSGNYDVYLQRLDANGNVMFGNGLLVSDNAQNSWVTEWDFAVDANDNAIVCTNDVRAGTDWDVYGYSIAPDGTFNWGPDGIVLSDDTDDDLAQQICVCANGDVVFAWQSDLNINLRRVDSNGADVWDPAIIEITDLYQVSIPRMAPTSDGGFILQWIASQGSMFWSPRWLYINRFAVDGSAEWDAYGVNLNNVGGLGIQMRPKVVNDGNDGAISYWYDSHIDNLLHVFVQHTNQDGIVMWAENGVQASTNTAEIQMTPTIAFDDANDAVYVMYQTANTGQTMNGIGAQKFDLDGNRLWTDNGVAITPLGNNQPYAQRGFVVDGGGIMMSYKEAVFGENYSYIMATRINADGTTAWDGAPFYLCNVESPKGDHEATLTTNEQLVAVWTDDRSDPSGDLYMQNINPDGTLGAYGTPDPIYVELLNAAPLTIPAAGGTIDYDVHIVNSTATPYPNIFYFTDVELPNGNWINNVFSARFTLAAGMDVTVAGLSQDVPSYAPAGTYTYYGSIGYPNGPHVSNSFQFEKSATAADGVNDWSTHGAFMVAAEAAEALALPNAYALNAAYPNPFNPTTTISVALPEAADLSVTVVNTLGQQVAELTHGRTAAGTHAFTFDASSLSSGIYFVRATVPGQLNAVQKVVLMK
ncbi:T9SS type A sorting domain-containing protein [bacterium]|nr:T9SS type A sorting domain-containing protein [bacterium]